MREEAMTEDESRQQASQPSNGLRTSRRAFALAALVLLAVWLFVAWSALQARQQAFDANAIIMERMVAAVEKQTVSHFESVQMALLAADHWIAANPGRDPRFDPGFARLIEEFRHLAGGNINLRLVSPHGGLYSIPSTVGRPIEVVDDREYFRQALSGTPGATHYGPAVVSRISSRWIYPVSRGLSLRQHDVAVIVAEIELDSLSNDFEGQRPPHWTIGMATSDSKLLMLAPRLDHLIARNVSFISDLGAPLAAGSRATLVTDQTHSGRTMQVSYAVLVDYPVMVGVGVPTKAVLGVWRNNLLISLGAALALTLLVGAVLHHGLKLLASLAETRDHLRSAASHDAMTGTFNHTAFVEILDREFARSRRYGQPLSVMMLDVDFFKRINDGYGHAVGDEALRAFAKVLDDGVRTVDAIGRLGGEEFSVMLPNTAIEDAQQLAERLRESAAAIVIHTVDGEDVRFTTSVGVAEVSLDDIGVEDLLRRADAALYLAKEHGRNRVEVSTPGDQPIA